MTVQFDTLRLIDALKMTWHYCGNDYSSSIPSTNCLILWKVSSVQDGAGKVAEIV